MTYLKPTGSQKGTNENMKDTTRGLGRVYDGVEYRGFGQEKVEVLAEYAGVSVWSGLTNEIHPTQVLVDLMTMIDFSDEPLCHVFFYLSGRCSQQHGKFAFGGGGEDGDGGV